MIKFSRVDIGKRVSFNDLEKALIDAAKEIGWNAKAEDKFFKHYKLGSVSELEIYDRTDIKLRGDFFTKAEVSILNNKEPKEYFYMLSGFLLASENKIKEYLSIVSDRLKESKNIPYLKYHI